MTEAPTVAVGGHHYCECGQPEPIRYCDSDCTRPFRGHLEEGSCLRCRFWLAHKHGDHRRWWGLKNDEKTVRR